MAGSGCDRNTAWFESDDGQKFGLNGFATDHGYAEIEPIWAVDGKMMSSLRAAGVSDGSTIRISITDLTGEALKLC